MLTSQKLPQFLNPRAISHQETKLKGVKNITCRAEIAQLTSVELQQFKQAGDLALSVFLPLSDAFIILQTRAVVLKLI